MITMTQSPVPGTHSKRGIAWRAVALGHHADSRSGAPMALARLLMAAGVPDQPVEVITEGIRGQTNYRSLHAMADRTIEEGAATPIHSRRYKAPPADLASKQGRHSENGGDDTANE